MRDPGGQAPRVPQKTADSKFTPLTRLLKTKPAVAHNLVSLISFGFTTRYAGVTEARSWRSISVPSPGGLLRGFATRCGQEQWQVWS